MLEVCFNTHSKRKELVRQQNILSRSETKIFSQY